MRMSRQRVIALLVLTCILLVTLDSRGSATLDRARAKFGDWLSPLQGVGRSIAVPIHNAWRGITDYSELQRENDRLRELVQLQQGDAIAGEAAIRSYQELLAQADLESVRDYSNVSAAVLTYGASNNRMTVEINKGSDDGIRVGFPVVNAGGLVGKITQVSRNRAIVLLLSDPNYSVPVTISGGQTIPGSTAAAANGEPPIGGETTTTSSVPSGSLAESLDPSLVAEDGTALPSDLAAEEAGPADLNPAFGQNGDPGIEQTEVTTGETTPDGSPVPTTTTPPTTTTVFDLKKLRPRETGGLEGRGPGKNPVVRFIGNDRKGRQIQPGDVVLTNGGTEASGQLSSLAPADLVVGRVKSVVERPGGVGPEIEVEPAADLERLNFVRVIRYIPPSEVPGS